MKTRLVTPLLALTDAGEAIQLVTGPGANLFLRVITTPVTVLYGRNKRWDHSLEGHHVWTGRWVRLR